MGKAREYIKCKESTDHLSENNAGSKPSIRFMLAKPVRPIDIDIPMTDGKLPVLP
jgi:hypothetical protein